MLIAWSTVFRIEAKCYILQMIISFKLRTEESSGNEYFNEINSVAAVVKFGSTDVQELGHGV